MLQTLISKFIFTSTYLGIGNASNIIQFAQRYHLQSTLHCLSSEDDDTSDQSPKVRHFNTKLTGYKTSCFNI